MPSETKNRFLILYGSQTGQAKAIAEELQEKSDSYGLQSDLHCLSQTEKKFNLEREQCVVFVVSTTGDGEAPDTVQKFWRRLHKRTLSDTHLQHLHFSLLGLGDTNYTNFCKCGKGLDRRLELLGARRFYPSAWADDGVGLEVAAEPWIDGVLPAVRRFLGLPPISRQIEETIGRGDNSDTTTSDNLSELTSGTDNSESDATDSNQTNPSVRVQQTDPSNSGKTNGMTLVDFGKGIIPDSASTESPADLTQTPSVGSTDTASPADSRKLGRFESNGAADPVNITAGGEGLGEETAGRVTSLKWSAGLRESNLTLPLLPPPYLDLRFTESKGQVTSELPYQNGCPLPSASSPVTMATIVSARQLTAAEAVKTALDIELQTEPGTLGYAPGDSVSVVCPNPEEEVCQLFNRLGVSGDQWYELSVKPDTKKRRAAIPPHLHPASTLHHAFSTCLDLRHPPKKALLRALVEVTSDPQEKRRLQELCSKQGAAEYSQFIHDASLSLLDILAAFPSCSPSVERLLEQLPRLQPRPYSVASSPLVHADRLHIVFNVVEVGGCEDRRARRGVCTGWLDHLTHSLRTGSLHQQLEGMKLTDTPQISIPIFGRTNQQFRMPEDLSVPLILIGPGTGVAPFVGFLQHREHLVANQKPENVGETWLFFGCRHQQRDFLYREELERLHKASVLTRLCASFSRDEDRGDNPRYVQDNLRLHGPEIVSLLEDHNASVFVCGDAKHMARNVNDQFVEIYEKCKGLTGGEARSRVMSLRLARRYLEDVWT